MRKIIILLLIFLLNISCREVKMTVAGSKNDTIDVSSKKHQETATKKIILKNVGKNSYSVYDFILTSDERIFAVGIGPTSGVIYTSENLGKSWQVEKIPSICTGCSVSYITENSGNIFITETGGSIWIKKPEQWQKIYDSKDPENSPETDFRYLQFANKQVGFAVNRTDYGVKIFKTQDGGENWKKIYENTIAGNPFDLLVIDETTVIIAMNDEYILRTEDSGKTWVAQELDNTGRIIKKDEWIDLKNSGASDLTLTSEGIVWVVGEKGSLYYSDDKGKIWKRPNQMPNSIQQQNLKSIAFSTEGKGIAVGENGYIIISEDKGKTWSEISQNLLQENIIKNEVTKNFDKLLRIKFANEKAIILGSEGIYEISLEE